MAKQNEPLTIKGHTVNVEYFKGKSIDQVRRALSRSYPVGEISRVWKAVNQPKDDPKDEPEGEAK